MSERPLWRLIAGRKAGPYEPAKLRPLVKDGRIGPLDRFSYDGVSWQPVTDFPELLRPPTQPAAAAAGGAKAFDPLAEDADGVDLLSPGGGEPPALRTGLAPQHDAGSMDDAKLLKAIYMLIAFGGALFVLLIGYMILSSVLSSQATAPVPPQSDPTAAATPPSSPVGEESAAAGRPLQPSAPAGGEPLADNAAPLLKPDLPPADSPIPDPTMVEEKETRPAEPVE